MPTASTVVAFKTALVAALQARAGLAGVQVAYAWPGPDTLTEGIWLGGVEGSSAIPNIKAGRKQRQEDYRVEVIVQVVNQNVTVDDASTVEDRAFDLLAEIDGALADDVDLGTSVQWSSLGDWSEEVTPAGQGWAYRLTATVEVHARLT